MTGLAVGVRDVASPLWVSVLVAGLPWMSFRPADAAGGVGVTPAPARAVPASDTVVEARRGDRLVVWNLEGRIEIRGGQGETVRVESAPGDRGALRVRRDGDRLVVEDRNRRSRSLERRLRIEVPSWLELDIRGEELDVEVAGLRSRVRIRSVEGDLVLEDVQGEVDVASVDGEVRLADVRGTVTAGSVDDGVYLRRVGGEVRIESTDGDLVLEEMDAERVEAVTVDGDVDFSGRLRADGLYRLGTHGGDLTVSVPRGVDARVSVATFDGSFEAAFPVTVDRFSGGREMSFTLGSGGARLVLEAFDGDIRMRYAGGAR